MQFEHIERGTSQADGGTTTGHRPERLAALRREVKQALRSSARTPVLTLMVLVILSLGVGATTAMFTLVDAVLLRPLPYPAAARLVSIGSRMPAIKAFADRRLGLSDAQYFFFKSTSHTLEDLGAYDSRGQLTTLTADGPAERVNSAYVTASLVKVLGLAPHRGRTIGPNDDIPGMRGQVAMLGYELWARRYGSDSSVVGRTLTLDGKHVLVIGVLKSGMQLPDRNVDLWLPLGANPAAPARNIHHLLTVARVGQGVSFDAVRREMTALSGRLPEAFPGVYTPDFLTRSGYATDVTHLRDDVVGTTGRLLWMLLAAVGLVLVIACVNVANAFLVRAETRRRESAIRLALGARYVHFVRQHMVESLLVTVFAAVVGVLLAFLGVRLFAATAPWAIPRLNEIQLRPSSVFFAALIAVCAGITFGALQLVGLSSSSKALREDGRGTTLSRRQRAVRGIFVVSQVAMAVVLLAASGIMIRSVRDLEAVHPGFRSDGTLTVEMVLPDKGAETPESASAIWQNLVTQLSALSGVSGVAAGDLVPLGEDAGCSVVFVENQPLRSPTDEAPCVRTVSVTPGYFETLQIPVRGSTLSWSDNNAAAGGVVVSRALAARFWPNQDPIGKGIKGNDDAPPYYRVIGVSGDVRANGLDKPPVEAVYFPLIPIPDAPLWDAVRGMSLLIHTSRGDPTRLVPDVRRTLAAIAPDVPITRIRTMDAIVASATARVKFVMLILIVAATMALLLSAVGLYTVIAYVTGQRRMEIGIRMALGATSSRIVGSVVAQSLTLAVIGVVFGLFGAVAAMGALRSLLFEASLGEPVTLVAVSLLLMAVAVVAGYLPARKAARIQPVEALR
ncbi:MAG: ABC transporter permease [Gemmatimonadaceae bacterium]